MLDTHPDLIGSRGQAPVKAYFGALLEAGVDEMAWNDLGDDKASPHVTACLAFATQVAYFSMPF